MQLKTFVARNTAEAIGMIKAELGPEAVILETREDQGMVSITAATEPEGAAPGASAPQGRGQAPDWRLWQEEWNAIKTHLMALVKPALQMERLASRQKVALEFLQREGVEDAALLELYRRLLEDPESSILTPLRGMVAARPWSAEAWPQTFHCVAGPYGTGKTSAVIRMALALRNAHPELRLCVINADAGRANGRHFLRHSCELSDIPCKEAFSLQEVADQSDRAVDEGYERVLVDLPGIDRTGALAPLLDTARLSGRKTSVHLVLTPQFGQAALQRCLSRYHSGLPTGIVWAKLDEAEHFGQLVNTGFTSSLPVSALSFGPGLGHTLLPAEDMLLWRMLFRKELPARN